MEEENKLIIFGKYTYGNPEIRWKIPGTKVIIGSFTSIAAGVKIYLGNGFGHDANFITTYPFGFIHKDIFPNVENKSKNTNGDVVIGNDVWIGENTTIMSGVKIADGVIIAANSHVIKDVEPYSIVGGNPAQFIKYRFKAEQIEKLKQIAWWNWDDKKINDNMDLLLSGNIDKFIEKHIK